jgi:hypothetical protein
MAVISKNLVSSAIFAAIGLTFLYYASVGEDKWSMSAVLFKVGCALSCFSLAVHPSALYKQVVQKGPVVSLPKASGYASVLNVLSLGCYALAAGVWLIK